jgi:hypothetical protein
MNERDYIDFLKESKKKMRKEFIAMSFEEKIKRVVEMQRFSRDFKKNKDKTVYVWELI